jgi:hypothetical protein
VSDFFSAVYLKGSIARIAFAFGLMLSGAHSWFSAKVDAVLHEALDPTAPFIKEATE